MSDAATREWRFYIDDMITCAENVIAYTNGFDQEQFVASGLIDGHLGIHVVAVRVHFGNRSYLDKVTTIATEFYRELASNPAHPKTSQHRRANSAACANSSHRTTTASFRSH